jgi:hypothetical protein
MKGHGGTCGVMTPVRAEDISTDEVLSSIEYHPLLQIFLALYPSSSHFGN